MAIVVDPQNQASTESEVEREFTVESRGQWQQVARRFLHNKPGMVGLLVFVLMMLGSFVGPLFYSTTYLDQDDAFLSAPPSLHNGHLLGTDQLGRDMLAQLMHGMQRTALICLIVVGLGGAIGTLIGAMAGYFSGRIDNALMRVVDLFLIFPGLIAIAVISAAFESRTALLVAVILAVFGWPPLARIVRANFLSLREREFVEAAHALGASNWRIMFRHMIPNSLSIIIVWTTLAAATAVIVEATLSFLGYGIQGQDVSLGKLISNGVPAAQTREWLFYFPGIALLLFVLSLNLVGDAIRDAFDPSNKRVRA